MTKAVKLNEREKSDLRDQFAMAVLTGLTASQHWDDIIDSQTAIRSYIIADEMMKVREGE